MKSLVGSVVIVLMLTAPAGAWMDKPEKSSAVAVAGSVASASVRNDVSIKNWTSQFQAQTQSQKNRIDLNNGQTIAPKQEVQVVNPANKRDLLQISGYQAPQMVEYRGPYEKGVAGRVKPWKEQTEWTEKEIEAYYGQFDGADCRVYKHRDVAKRTAIRVADSSSPVIAYLHCKGESDFEIWGTAGKKALELGCTNIQEKAYSVTYSNKSTGWNIGIGGGVSSTGYSDDSKSTSVGGGTGFGSAETTPVPKINVIFVVR